MTASSIHCSRTPSRLAGMLAPETNSFGVIRLMMAVAVLMSHSYWFTSGQGGSEPLYSWTGHSLGEHAVQVFFFLSGVLVTQSLLKSGSVLDFACGRTLRIFPGLTACVLFTALILGPSVSTLTLGQYLTEPELTSYVAKTFFLTTGSAGLPGVFTDVPLSGLVNVSLLTLKYEVLCYAGLGLVAAVGVLREQTRAFAIAGLAILVFSIFIGPPKPIDDYSQLDNARYFTLFFGMGALACLLKKHIIISKFVLAPLFGFFVAAIGTRWAELSTALFLGYATLYVATWTFGPLRRFTNEQDYSFGVYIYAGPIQQALIGLKLGLTPLALSFAALPVALVLAVISWNMIEKPALLLRKRLIRILNDFNSKYWPKGKLCESVRSRLEMRIAAVKYDTQQNVG